jgi:hypothetical protein
MGKQGGEFLMAALEKIVCRILYQDLKQIYCYLLGNIFVNCWENSAKSVGKQGEEFLMVALEKSYQELSKIGESHLLGHLLPSQHRHNRGLCRGTKAL